MYGLEYLVDLHMICKCMFSGMVVCPIEMCSSIRCDPLLGHVQLGAGKHLAPGEGDNLVWTVRKDGRLLQGCQDNNMWARNALLFMGDCPGGGTMAHAGSGQGCGECLLYVSNARSHLHVYVLIYVRC